MTSTASSLHPDIVILYHERDTIDSVVESVVSLDVSFKSMLANEQTLTRLVKIKPKVVLFVLDHISQSIQYYVHYLEKLQDQQNTPYSVLLINNKEARRAFFACENGLFDNYAVINPLNERYRLKFIILKSLALINARRGDAVMKLMQEGEEELAICIDRGTQLKQSLAHRIQQCKEQLLDKTKVISSPADNRYLIKTVTDDIFKQLHHDLNQHMGNFISNLIDVNKVQQLVNNKLQEKMCAETQNVDALKKQLDHLADFDEISDSESINDKEVQFKLLIGENSTLFAKVIADIFLDEGFLVTIAQDGREVIEKASKIKPDIIMLSYYLPKLNGIEVTEKLRTMAACKETPIIAFSSNKDKKLIKKWIPLGLSAYLVKPSSRSVIYSTVLYELTHPSPLLKTELGDMKQGMSIKWLPEYSVGDKVMDKHHQILFDIINEYFATDYHDNEAVRVIFSKLSDYVSFHFKAEEKLMLEKHYPKLEQHIRFHEVFLKKLVVIESKLGENDEDMSNKIGMFLYKWLTKHILGADMAYKSYVTDEK